MAAPGYGEDPKGYRERLAKLRTALDKASGDTRRLARQEQMSTIGLQSLFGGAVDIHID